MQVPSLVTLCLRVLRTVRTPSTTGRTYWINRVGITDTVGVVKAYLTQVGKKGGGALIRRSESFPVCLTIRDETGKTYMVRTDGVEGVVLKLVPSYIPPRRYPHTRVIHALVPMNVPRDDQMFDMTEDVVTIVRRKLESYDTRDRAENHSDTTATLDEALHLLRQSSKYCPGCGCAMLYRNYTPYCEYQFSFDRIDVAKAHSAENLRVVCYGCNARIIDGCGKLCQKKCHRTQTQFVVMDCKFQCIYHYQPLDIPVYLCPCPNGFKGHLAVECPSIAPPRFIGTRTIIYNPIKSIGSMIDISRDEIVRLLINDSTRSNTDVSNLPSIRDDSG